MFDFHMHSRVSFDGHDTGIAMAQVAKAAGLKEICFTDHLDYDPRGLMKMDFDTDSYNAAYDGLEVPGLTIRRGAEFGMLRHNPEQLKKDLRQKTVCLSSTRKRKSFAHPLNHKLYTSEN